MVCYEFIRVACYSAVLVPCLPHSSRFLLSTVILIALVNLDMNARIEAAVQYSDRWFRCQICFATANWTCVSLEGVRTGGRGREGACSHHASPYMVYR